MCEELENNNNFEVIGNFRILCFLITFRQCVLYRKEQTNKQKPNET